MTGVHVVEQQRPSSPKRPVLRYHGGKWRLAPWIIAHFPAHRVYTEVFGGAASVLMRKPRSEVEVYNDLDSEVVNVFRVLRDPERAASLERALRLTPFARSEYARCYEPAGGELEQARRTLVKAWMGFGSGAITHRHAGFRVATSKTRHTAREWSGFPDQIASFVDRFAGVLIEERSAITVLAKHDAPDALHYVDPPYVTETRGPRHRYRHEMDADGHRELAANLHACKGSVVVSGYDSELYAVLYHGWKSVMRPAIDALSRGRTEVLWLNARCAEALERAA